MVSFTTFILPLFLAGSALAGYNCNCQDSRGQFNEATYQCCQKQLWYGLLVPGATYYPGPNHQFVNPNNGLDSGAFVDCCRSLGVNDAFCWKYSCNGS